MISDQEAVEVVHSAMQVTAHVHEQVELQRAAQLLVETALEKGSMDNISVVLVRVLWLNG